jgi:hypothetical protein
MEWNSGLIGEGGGRLLFGIGEDAKLDELTKDLPLL